MIAFSSAKQIVTAVVLSAVVFGITYWAIDVHYGTILQIMKG